MKAAIIGRTLVHHRSYWLVSAAAVLFGTVTVGGQYFSNKGLSLYEIAFFPLLLTFLMVLPGLLLCRRKLKGLPLTHFVIYGLIGALAELAQFGGIVLGVPVAVTSLLLFSQPIWTCLLAKIMLHESISSRKIIATLLTLLGVALLVKSDIGGVEYDARGLGAALLGSVFISLWVIWGRKSGINQHHYVLTTSAWSGFSTLWLLALWPIIERLTVNAESISRLSFQSLSEYWPHLTSFALVAGVLPGLLLFRGLQSVPASSAGIILLLEPVSATLMASIIFSQQINGFILAGGVLILLANATVMTEGGITSSHD